MTLAPRVRDLVPGQSQPPVAREPDSPRVVEDGTGIVTVLITIAVIIGALVLLIRLPRR